MLFLKKKSGSWSIYVRLDSFASYVMLLTVINLGKFYRVLWMDIRTKNDFQKLFSITVAISMDAVTAAHLLERISRSYTIKKMQLLYKETTNSKDC